MLSSGQPAETPSPPVALTLATHAQTKMQRMLITGLHKVADIRCATCDNVLGWKYERAYEESQIYKEGKYVLEKALLCEERRAR